MADAKFTNDGSEDPMGPPHIPVEVCCIHCGEEYQSYLIEWRGKPRGKGFWCCPTPGCDGIGFCFDIWPTDPDWRDENGEKVCFFTDDDDEAEFFDDEEWSLDETNLPDRTHPTDSGDPSTEFNDEDIPF